MANILPRDLDAAASVPEAAALIIDNGVSVEKATPAQLVDAGRPNANQAEAEEGADNAKGMTPLRVKQAIAAQATIPSILGELGNEDGSTYVGTIQPFTGAVARTLAAKLLDTVSVFDFMSEAQIAAVRAGASTNDNAAVLAALAAAKTVKFPAGTYRIGGVEIPSGRTITGDGIDATVLKTRDGAAANRPITANNKSNITIENLTLDNNGGSGLTAYLGYFSGCTNITVRRCRLTNCVGNGVHFVNCIGAHVDSIRCDLMGAKPGYAAIGFGGTFGSGHTVRNVTGYTITGRLVSFFYQTSATIDGIQHDNTNKGGGEALYFNHTKNVVFSNVSQIGGGGGSPEAPNPGNDGVAIDVGCENITGSNINLRDVSGHGVSISIDASRNTLSNLSIIRPDEGGVSITDQGQDEGGCNGNVITNCYVEDVGMRLMDSPYVVYGGSDNVFVNCSYRDTRGEDKRAIYGFQEANGAGTAERNHWSGKVEASETLSGEYALVSASSSASNLANKSTGTHAVFDGTGADAAEMVLLRHSPNILKIVKQEVGSWRVYYRSIMNGNPIVFGSGRYLGGASTLNRGAATETYVDILLFTDGNTPIDSDEIAFVVL